MKCPICAVNLVMAERQGVEIDYCPKCRGVWLDRGELDKIIEKATEPAVLTAPEPAEPVREWREPQPADEAPRQWREPHRDRGAAREWREPYRESEGDERDERDEGEWRGDKDRAHGKRRKRKSFLEDIFDFDLFD